MLVLFFTSFNNNLHYQLWSYLQTFHATVAVVIEIVL